MANDLILYERAIDLAMPEISNILAATPGLPARSFKAGLLSQMRNAKSANRILACTVPSILNCAATFAGLGLMPDGVTGQAFILPFKDTATPVIGYKGYNTLGDRAGRTITGDVWRDGDLLEYEQGSNAFVRWKPSGPPGQRRIMGAWSDASAPNRRSIVKVLYIDELEQVRQRSPSVKNNASSPWDDLVIGRPAMYAKTAKRRIASSMPLLTGAAGNYVVADAIETQFEVTGNPHYLLPGQDGRLVVTDGVTGAPVDIKPPPTDGADPTEPVRLLAQINAGQPPSEFDNPTEWKVALLKIVSLYAKNESALRKILEANAPYLADASTAGFGDDAQEVGRAIATALDRLKK